MSNFSEKLTTRVFLAEIPNNVNVVPLYPIERYEEILNTSNECAKREKYFVWHLLERALLESRGIRINDVEFKKDQNGRWTAKGFDFSLSHSKGVAAVVISDTSCGIDIERVCAPKSESFSKRILADFEYAEFSSLAKESREEYLIKKWTQKEALFKARNLAAFIPAETVARSGEFVKTEKLIINGKQYFCSVALISGCEKIDFVVLGAEKIKF